VASSGCRGVEFAQDNPRVTEQFGEFRSSVGAYGADFGERERRQVQGQTDGV
jgi:hypothetical protein